MSKYAIDYTCRYLDECGVKYTVLNDPTNDGISGTKTCEMLGRSPAEVYKTVLISTDRKDLRFFAVLPSDRRLDTEKLSQLTEAPCRPADKATAKKLCKNESGLFSPFFPEKLPVYLDASAKALDRIVINGGGAGNYIELTVSDLISVTGGRLADISGEPSPELYGRNYALPLGSRVGSRLITGVKKILPLEIMYEAQNSETRQAEWLFEYFPRFKGHHACRSANGETVSWLRYADDAHPSLSPEVSEAAKSLYLLSFPNTLFPSIEANNTYYAASAPVKGEVLSDYIAKNGCMPPDMAESALLPLLDKISELKGQQRGFFGNLRPDNVFIDPETGKAEFIPCRVPTGVFGQYYSGYFAPNTDYDPFIIIETPQPDEAALYRLLCYAVTGRRWQEGCTGEAVNAVIGSCFSPSCARSILEKAVL